MNDTLWNLQPQSILLRLRVNTVDWPNNMPQWVSFIGIMFGYVCYRSLSNLDASLGPHYDTIINYPFELWPLLLLLGVIVAGHLWGIFYVGRVCLKRFVDSFFDAKM